MSAGTEDAAAASCVTDHRFIAPSGRPWDRCAICSLSEAAHIETTAEWNLLRERPAWLTGSYRCPYCVHHEIDPCPHGRHGALDLKGGELHGDG